jgi:hypothetical protein
LFFEAKNMDCSSHVTRISSSIGFNAIERPFRKVG